MSESRDVKALAELLRELKSRADRSYEALARRTGVSGSALHRYCSGASVPGEYDVIGRFGKACGASREELLELHRRWSLADAERRRAQSPAAKEPEQPGDAGTVGDTGAARDTDTATVQEPDADTDGDAGAGPGRASEPTTGASPAEEPAQRGPRWPRRLAAGALLAAAVAVTAAAFLLLDSNAATSAGSAKDRLLLSAKCPTAVNKGQRGECVREVQLLLAQAGGELEIDGAFGPVTEMRVVVFKLYAGLAANGVVDERTKRALYAGAADLTTWSPDRVNQRIREVFTEDPDRAVEIANCSSYLDPLYTLPSGEGNGPRNWGVFQLYDHTLRRLGGTRAQALDPEWNIRAAHRLWTMTHDFSAWTYCSGEHPSAHP